MKAAQIRETATAEAPAAIGPYSQAVITVGTAKTIYVSGQLPINPADGSMQQEVRAQTAQSLENIRAILFAEGLGMENVVKTEVLLADIGDFTAMNEVYATYFKAPFPARAAYQVAALPKGARVEIAAIAVG